VYESTCLGTKLPPTHPFWHFFLVIFGLIPTTMSSTTSTDDSDDSLDEEPHKNECLYQGKLFLAAINVHKYIRTSLQGKL
jgi:hypothetical protein